MYKVGNYQVEIDDPYDLYPFAQELVKKHYKQPARGPRRDPDKIAADIIAVLVKLFGYPTKDLYVDVVIEEINRLKGEGVYDNVDRYSYFEGNNLNMVTLGFLFDDETAEPTDTYAEISEILDYSVHNVNIQYEVPEYYLESAAGVNKMMSYLNGVGKDLFDFFAEGIHKASRRLQ